MVTFSQRFSEHRTTFILIVLVSASLVSLASGAKGGPIASGVRGVAEVAAIPFRAGLNLVENQTAYFSALLIDYGQARDESRSLRRRLGVMLQHVAQRQELVAENGRLRAIVGFQKAKPQLSLMPVQVLQHFEGILTINRGATHGMRPSLCVITEDGVVGIVTQVNLFTSNVATLQSADCKVDAMIRRNRVRGTVHGTGNDLTRLCTMQYIDLKDDVVEGDQVVTSPDSIFPSGYPVGIIVSVTRDEGLLLQSADIEPIADPFRLDEVFVLLSADIAWQDLAGSEYESEADREYPPTMDVDSIQDRYAP